MDLLDFAAKVSELKRLKRAGWILKGVKAPESVADHSFMLAVLAYVYAKQTGLDSGRCVKLALVHDLCEAYSGDIPSRIRKKDRTMPGKMKKKLEEEGMKKIVALLPDGTAKEITGLWKEFEEQKTKEAQLIRDLDKLEMCMQALAYATTNPGTDFSEFFEDGRQNIQTPEMKKVFGKILGEFQTLPEKKRRAI